MYTLVVESGAPGDGLGLLQQFGKAGSKIYQNIVLVYLVLRGLAITAHEVNEADEVMWLLRCLSSSVDTII
jgi:hypothetical protein